uniref:SH2 domain-containing protein n=1 Tax=Macrostomum lignano TaxID=282301 RepID=A0A1I8HL14_9PLAT
GGNGSGGVGGAGLPEHILALHSGDKLVRCAAYIGSFPVEGADQRQRTEFVHQQLEAMQGCGRSRPVQLWIALTGVKVCDHTGEQVLMAHALRRISYANCNPDHQQFAFMAREPKTQPAQPSAPGAPVENFRSAYGNPVIVLKECIDQSVTSGGGILVGPAALAAGGSGGGRDTVDAPTIGRNLVNNNGFSVGTSAPSATDVESPPPPLPLRYDSLRPSSSDRTLEPPLSSELTPAAWYQADLPRDLALELLSREEIGGFIVRDSSTHVNCYALSVRVPRQDNPSGYAHYLIQRTARGVKLKGLPKEWPSLQSLVCHLSVMPEMLPCPLRLPRQQENPIYSEHPPVPPGAGGSGGGGPANPEPEDLAGQACPYGLNLPPDEDYQRLSDFSSIMAELRV